MWKSCLLFSSILAFISPVFSTVPVLIWNTHKSDELNVPAVSALQQISVASLQARYLESFQPKNILLFLQDALSIEDLSSHRAELEHVSKFIESSGHSLYLPNVVDPSHLQHELIKEGYKVTKLTAGSAISELKLDPSANNLVVVKLPPTITNPSRSNAIRKADEVMQSVLSKIGEMADFTVIYTGVEPTLDSAGGGSAGRVRISRSLKQFGMRKTVPLNYHNTSCVALYLRNNMTISFNGSLGPFYEIDENIISEAMGDCTANNSIALKYGDVTLGSKKAYSIRITFFFTRKSGYYRSPSAEVQVQDSANASPDKVKLQLVSWYDDSLAVGKSYSCNKMITYRQIGANASQPNTIELHLNGFQVEAYMNNTSKFHSSWDCVGFFSIGIWAGLITVLLMVIILTMGLYMLADVKTMDRFEDPKGKSIVVPQSSD